MPELPDVEVYRRYIDATSLHQRIRHTRLESPRILKETSARGLGRALKDQMFQSTARHGKYLFIAVKDHGWLLMHFGMTGTVEYLETDREPHRFARLLVDFDNGHSLAYISRRMLGWINLVDSPRDYIMERKLGPDTLELGEKEFMELAGKSGGGIKAWLMEQEHIAGIGNVYSDEILFQARIHPKQTLSRLDEKDLRRVYKAIRAVMQKAIKAEADPKRMPPGFLLPNRHKKGRCPGCGSPPESLKAAGRTAWYCPDCQRL